ncbi:hypothetical protein Bpfe_004786 [Biomphalaria pfeifferi]|uniref:Uncharacterized protein n=1 Tax=Biomphalaria pfeifferi TaxID=112525 RepID=A0AAD8FK23_BIOPF|nr:hypothetical protein Bpfe_004786 [Biomphalaria pfeifferi]
MAIKDWRELLNANTGQDDDYTVKSKTSTDNLNLTLEWVTPTLKPQDRSKSIRLMRSSSIEPRSIYDQEKHGLSLKPKMANGNPN